MTLGEYVVVDSGFTFLDKPDKCCDVWWKPCTTLVVFVLLSVRVADDIVADVGEILTVVGVVLLAALTVTEDTGRELAVAVVVLFNEIKRESVVMDVVTVVVVVADVFFLLTCVCAVADVFAGGAGYTPNDATVDTSELIVLLDFASEDVFVADFDDFADEIICFVLLPPAKTDVAVVTVEASMGPVVSNFLWLARERCVSRMSLTLLICI